MEELYPYMNTVSPKNYPLSNIPKNSWTLQGPVEMVIYEQDFYIYFFQKHDKWTNYLQNKVLVNHDNHLAQIVAGIVESKINSVTESWFRWWMVSSRCLMYTFDFRLISSFK